MAWSAIFTGDVASGVRSGVEAAMPMPREIPEPSVAPFRLSQSRARRGRAVGLPDALDSP